MPWFTHSINYLALGRGLIPVAKVRYFIAYHGILLFGGAFDPKPSDTETYLGCPVVN